MTGHNVSDQALIASFIAARGITRVPPGEARGIYKVSIKGRKHAPRQSGHGRKGRQLKRR